MKLEEILLTAVFIVVYTVEYGAQTCVASRHRNSG